MVYVCVVCLFFSLSQNVRKDSEACRWDWNFHQKDIPQLTSKSWRSRTRKQARIEKAVKRVLRRQMMMIRALIFKVRYVSEYDSVCISSFFHDLELLPIWSVGILVMLHQEIYDELCATKKKSDWKSDFSWCSYGFWKHTIEYYIGLLDCVQYWVWRIVSS